MSGWELIDFCVAIMAIAVALRALWCAKRCHQRARVEVLAELGDPTGYGVVTDGKTFRVRGPFDTFYTAGFRNHKDAHDYAQQLAHWHRTGYGGEANWRAA